MAVVGMSMAVVRTWDSGVAREQTAWRDSPLQLDTAVFPTGAKAESLSCSTEAERVPTGGKCRGMSGCKKSGGECVKATSRCVCKPGSCLSADKTCASMAYAQYRSSYVQLGPCAHRSRALSPFRTVDTRSILICSYSPTGSAGVKKHVAEPITEEPDAAAVEGAEPDTPKQTSTPGQYTRTNLPPGMTARLAVPAASLSVISPRRLAPRHGMPLVVVCLHGISNLP